MTDAVRARMPTARSRDSSAAGQPGVQGTREELFSSLSSELRCSLDEDYGFLHLEGGWRGVLGWRHEELRGCSWAELVHPADRRRTHRAIDRLLASGGAESGLKLRMAAASGGHRLISWMLIAGPGPDRIIALGLAEPVQPTGERVALEGRVAELEAECEAVEQFAGMAAHQLAEPLVIAESSALLVAEELGADLDPFLRARLDAIGRGAARARQLIDALLHDARTAHRLPDLKPVRVGEVVHEVLGSMQAALLERGARTVVGPQPTVRADPVLLRVIYENLLYNALKYGPREGGEIRVDAQLASRGWRLSVTSEGSPIPEADVPRMFEPFRRLPDERRAQGSGLGLAICARLVERLGGTIGVEPREHGNSFFFVLAPA
jgi:signal transduction histidine kinase